MPRRAGPGESAVFESYGMTGDSEALRSCGGQNSVAECETGPKPIRGTPGLIEGKVSQNVCADKVFE